MTALVTLFLFLAAINAFQDIDYNLVKEDLKTLYKDSKDFWPADFGNYGPLFIRHAWHCAGSYRQYDGLGGCDGGRQRFDPERSWDDNTNLDKAKILLNPIKQKYGPGLSWGDLIILSGSISIESMGGPNLGFCGGRIDDVDGKDSILLGPTAEQNLKFPCPVNGKCKSPLGATTLGLIYVNPEGSMGNPNPPDSVPEIRSTFTDRMTMDDWETVALIGGGHAFGKAHGACPKGPGKSPKDDPTNPWPGLCGSGRGKDTFTSGFEGAWTTQPTKWDNEFFKNLIEEKWEVHVGPGGHNQWRPVNSTKNIFMLTSDLALLHDPIYLDIVKHFAANQTALDYYFSRAWYKLVSRDMGPVTRCVGPWVPPAQPWQNPLPPTPPELADFELVKADLKTLLTTKSAILPPDEHDGKVDYFGVFQQLAFQCASTFRKADYLGGCNGARIRFSPQKEWPTNAFLDKAIQMLDDIKKKYGDKLSWADLIVLAGNVAVELSSGKTLPFCGGRTDATDGEGSKSLQPNGDYSEVISLATGLTHRESLVLSARVRSPSQMERIGYHGSWSLTSKLSNEFFVSLTTETWEVYNTSKNIQFKAKGKDIFMTPSDLESKWNTEFLAIAEEYASNNDLFLNEFISSWTKLMNIDRFDGPKNNLCDKQNTPAPTNAGIEPTNAPTTQQTDAPTSPAELPSELTTLNKILIGVGGGLLLVSLILLGAVIKLKIDKNKYSDQGYGMIGS